MLLRGWALEQAGLELAHGAEDARDQIAGLAYRIDALHGLARVARISKVQDTDLMYQVAINEITANLNRRRDSVTTAAILDLQGNIVWASTGYDNPPVNIVDRDYWREIVVDGADDAIGTPVIGRLSNTPEVPLAHRLRDQNGRVVGVSLLSVDANAVAYGAKAGINEPVQTAITPHISIQIYRRDGLRLGGADGIDGDGSLPIPAALVERANWSSGIATDVVDRTGQQHIVALRKVQAIGLIVVASAASDAAIAAVAGSMNSIYAWAAVTCLLICGIGVFWAFSIIAYRRSQSEWLDRTAEEASRARLAELAQNLLDMVLIEELNADRRFELVYVSPSVRAILGISPEAHLANPTLYRAHPDDALIFQRRIDSLLAGEIPPLEAFRMLRGDGAAIWVEVASREIRGGIAPSGRRRFISCFRDISERKRAQIDLADSLHRFEVLLKTQPGWVMEIDIDIIENDGIDIRSWTFASGLTEVEGLLPLHGIDPISFLGDADPEFTKVRADAIRRALSGSAVTFEHPGRDGNGQPMHFRSNVALVRREHSQATLYWYAADITVEHDTREHLTQASKLSFLGEMASGIAHELHQPLSAIALQAETLAMEVPDGIPTAPVKAAVETRVAKIVALAERAAAVIRHVRDFSRRNTNPAAPFDLGNAIEAAIAIMDSRIRQSGVQVVWCNTIGTVTVLGHAVPFEQVVMNLVANAIDAYAARRPAVEGGRIDIVLTAADGQAQVTVSDRAGGIPEKVIGRVFEPFFTTKGVGKGTGLGLSLCFRIIHEMNGRISVRNQDGGAVFTLSMPCTVGENQMLPAAVSG